MKRKSSQAEAKCNFLLVYKPAQIICSYTKYIICQRERERERERAGKL